MWFGVKARHTDLGEMLRLDPEAVEFALFEEDLLDTRWLESVRVPDGLRLAVHAPEYIGGRIVDLSSHDDGFWRSSIEAVQGTIEVARILSKSFRDTPVVVVHPGGIRRQDQNTASDRLMQAVLQLDVSGVHLCLENMPEYYWVGEETWRGTLFKSPRQVRETLWEVGGVGLCLDVSHAAMWCNHNNKNLDEYILPLRRHIRHVHLSDTRGAKGEGLQIDEGDTDFRWLSRVLGPLDVVGVPEVKDGHEDEGAGFRVARDRLRAYGFF